VARNTLWQGWVEVNNFLHRNVQKLYDWGISGTEAAIGQIDRRYCTRNVRPYVSSSVIGNSATVGVHMSRDAVAEGDVLAVQYTQRNLSKLVSANSIHVSYIDTQTPDYSRYQRVPFKHASLVADDFSIL